MLFNFSKILYIVEAITERCSFEKDALKYRSLVTYKFSKILLKYLWVFRKAAGLEPATLLKNEPHVLHVFFILLLINTYFKEHLSLAAPQKYEK